MASAYFYFIHPRVNCWWVIGQRYTCPLLFRSSSPPQTFNLIFFWSLFNNINNIVICHKSYQLDLISLIFLTSLQLCVYIYVYVYKNVHICVCVFRWSFFTSAISLGSKRENFTWHKRLTQITPSQTSESNPVCTFASEHIGSVGHSTAAPAILGETEAIPAADTHEQSKPQYQVPLLIDQYLYTYLLNFLFLGLTEKTWQSWMW